MPIGAYPIIPHLAHLLRELRPQRILDLGIGSGFFGAVVRQWLDYGVRPWTTHLVGVEIWAEYGNPLWDLYDLVVVDSIQNYLTRNTETFDCVVLGDVLEHFEKEEGYHVMNHITQCLNPNGRLLVATPAVFVRQDATHGNEFERHRCLWSVEELEEIGFRILLDGQPDAFHSQMIFAEWTRVASA